MTNNVAINIPGRTFCFNLLCIITSKLRAMFKLHSRSEVNPFTWPQSEAPDQ